MKNNYLFNYLLKGKKSITFLLLSLFVLGALDATSQAVTQFESAEGNFFPMPGWRTRKGVLAEFSRTTAAASVAPTVPALATGTYSTGGAAAAVTGGGTAIVMLNSFTSSTDTSYLVTKPFDFSNNAGVNPTFSFWVYRDAGYPTQNDRLEVFWSGVSPGPGANLTPINHQGGSNVIPRLTTSFPSAINGAGWYEYKFTLPAATYNSKRNYFVIKGITELGNNMYLDNFTVNTYPSAMAAGEVVFDLVQQNGATTSQGATNQWILGVRCIVTGTSGCGSLAAAGVNNPVKLDSLLFNTNGCSNYATDILNAKVYYTGGYDQFNSTYVSPFPTTTGVTGATYPRPTYGATLTGGAIGTNLDFVNGSTNCFYLEYDTTYFWLVYDMKAAAVGGNYVDGDFRGAIVGGPATSCPSLPGSATCIPATTTTYTLVGACQIDIPYCVPTYSLGTSWAGYTNNDYVQSTSLIGYGGTAINATTNAIPLQLSSLTCFPNCRFVKHPPDYEYRSPTVAGNTVTLQQGGTYSITVQVGTYFSGNSISAWIDFNRDGAFNNSPMTWSGAAGTSAYTGERLGFATLTANGTATWTFTVPSTGASPAPFQGSTRLRVREWFAASATSMDPCLPGTWGECEDFIVTIIPNCSSAYRLWLGNTNDWNNPANWCPSVPTINDSTVIDKAVVNPGTRAYKYPIIKSGVLANCKSLYISNQDSLYIDAPNPSANSLKIAGNLINNGYINVIGAYNPSNNAVYPNSTGTLLNYLMTPLCGKTYKAAQTQIIYLASDLSLLGMQNGDKITAIQLNVKNNDGVVTTRQYQNFAIGYASSAIGSFTSTVPITGVTTVYTNASQPIVYGVNTFTLGTPIVWDGVSNLVIQYTFTNPSSTGSSNNDYIDITQSTGRNSTLVLGRLLTSVATVPAAGSFVGQVTGDISANGSPIVNLANTASALMTLRPNATFIWDRPYGKPKLVVQGNFVNNGPFNAGKSLFVMDSTMTQYISGTKPVPFYTFSMAKSAANRPIILNNDTVSIQDTFFLGTGQLLMNGKPLYMTWSNPAAFSRLIQGNGGTTAGTGVLVSENPNSVVNWTIGPFVAPASYRSIPFVNRLDTTSAVPAQTLIPLGFLHKQGDMGVFKAATKYWANNTLPDPPTVTHIDIFNAPTSNAANVVDRYWMIGKTGPQNPAANYPVADITMRLSTNATAPQVTERPATMNSLKPGWAQPWRAYGLSWLRISALATLNVSTVSSAVGNGTSITYTTSVAHSFVAGQSVTISGAMTPAGYNVINAVITSVPTTTTFTIAGVQTGASVGTSTATGASSGTTYSLSSATGSGTVMTYTTSAAHNLVPGQTVTVAGFTSPLGYNVSNAVILSTTSTTFTISGPTTGVSAGTPYVMAAPIGAAPSYNSQQTATSYAQAYTQVAASTFDSVRVVSWDWPIVPTLTSPYNTPTGPVGDYTPWTIAVNSTPLPIELLDFKARPDGKRVRLDWSTASEVDNDYFTVERTVDMNEYSFIEKVNSYMHNSNIMLNYTTYDEHPLYGLQYYRLKQTDFNGDYSYSEPQAVWFGSKAPFDITNIYSDMSLSSDINVDFMYNSEMPVSVEITDVSGRVIYSESGVAATNGSNKIKLNASLPHGLYFIIIRNDSDAVSRKFVY
ncbi:MAG: GEVED domain-containing protein [Bacteroidota bacterium]